MNVMLLVWRTNGKMGYPKSPMWEGEGEAWSEDESVSSGGSREGNVCRDALYVMRVVWAWWQDLSFLEGLGAGKGGFECHMALDMPCQEMREAW